MIMIVYIVMLSKFIINYKIFNIFHSYLSHYYALLNNIWAIHTTLYRVCCIEYIWLLLKAQCYVILCISYSKCIFFLIHQNQHNFWKTYTNFFHSYNLIARNQYNFKKKKKKKSASVYRIFTWKLSTKSILCCIFVQQYV